METNNDLQTVPLTAFESQAARMVRIIRYMAVGWAVSVAMLAALCFACVSYTDEAYTETITQESEDYGSNQYIGGDYNGYSDDYEDGESQA